MSPLDRRRFLAAAASLAAAAAGVPAASAPQTVRAVSTALRLVGTDRLGRPVVHVFHVVDGLLRQPEAGGGG